MDFNERISNTFGSLNATLKSVTDPPLKDDPGDDIHTVVEGPSHDKRSSRSRNDCRRFSDEPSRELRSRDRSPTSSRNHVRSRPVPKVPNYVIAPKKWTRYDLTEDGTNKQGYEGMNDDQVNRKAAFDFLNELSRRNTQSDPDEQATDLNRKITFKKPTSPQKVISSSKTTKKGQTVSIDKLSSVVPVVHDHTLQNDDLLERSTEQNEHLSYNDQLRDLSHDMAVKKEDSTTDQSDKFAKRVGQFQGGVLKMPEYFVGTKRTTITKSPKLINLKRDQPRIHLTHLDDEDDED